MGGYGWVGMGVHIRLSATKFPLKQRPANSRAQSTVRYNTIVIMI